MNEMCVIIYQNLADSIKNGMFVKSARRHYWYHGDFIVFRFIIHFLLFIIIFAIDRKQAVGCSKMSVTVD